MFQNIADAGSERENNTSSNVIYRLKEIFKYQNVIIYILTFLMSTLSVKGDFAPFGLAMMAACVGESVPLIGVFIAAIIGTFLGNGLAGLGNFITVSIIYFIIVLVFKTKIAIEDRNELVKTGGQLWFATFAVSILKSIMTVFTLYDVFMGLIISAMTYVFYKIFVNGLTFIKDLNIKKAFTIEELIAGVIISAIIVVIIWPDRIATLKDGSQNVATIKGINYTADELYEKMKDYYSVNQLLDMIDNIHELSEDSQQIALEEIVYVLYEREVKANE